MPSSSKKQAHYMSALDHGWSPPGKHPSRKVAHDFHEADKREGKWEHATGGPVSPLSSILGKGSSFGNRLGVQHLGGNPGGAFSGMMHFHAPRIPIADTMRNIDQKIGGAEAKIPKLGQKMNLGQKMAEGGGVHPHQQAITELIAALANLRRG